MASWYPSPVRLRRMGLAFARDFRMKLGNMLRTDSFARTVLWIDASYKAEDFNLNVSALPECQAWQKFWSINTTRKDGKVGITKNLKNI